MEVARRPNEIPVQGLGRNNGTRASSAIGVRGRGDRPCATGGRIARVLLWCTVDAVQQQTLTTMPAVDTVNSRRCK